MPQYYFTLPTSITLPTDGNKVALTTACEIHRDDSAVPNALPVAPGDYNVFFASDFDTATATDANLYTDDFNRANGEINVGRAEWTRRSASGRVINIASNKIQGGGAFANIYSYEDTVADDHFSELVCDVGSTQFASPAVAVQTDGDCLYCRHTTTAVQIREVTSGGTGDSFIAQVAISGGATDTLRIRLNRAAGNVIVSRNGTDILTHNIGSAIQAGGRLEGGKPGLHMNGNNASVQGENWQGGDV